MPLLALFLPPHAGKDNLAKSNSEHPVVRITSSCVLCGVPIMKNRLSVRSLRFLRVARAQRWVLPAPVAARRPVNPV